MRFVDEFDVLTIEQAHFPPTSEPTPIDPDVLLNVTVALRGYGAADQMWVTARDWAAFVGQFAELERTRRGEAVLMGALPEEFTLRFYVYSATGHLGVEGRLARRGPAEEHQKAQLNFAMRVDPGLLQLASTEFRSYRQYGVRDAQ